MSEPSEPPLPPKKDVAMALLKGPSLYVHLDPRVDDAVVPKWFKKQHQLVLQVGLNMAVPIPDLEVGDDGIVATLSFNRSPFWCFMPWTAIYALVGEDGRGMVWPDDVPSELAPKTQKPNLKVVGSKKPRKKASKADATGDKPKLAVAPPPAEDSDPAEDEHDEAPAPEPAVAAEAPEVAPAPDADERPDDEGESEGKTKLPPYLRVVK